MHSRYPIPAGPNRVEIRASNSRFIAQADVVQLRISLTVDQDTPFRTVIRERSNGSVECLMI